jgi:hypothetical protein
METLTAEQTLIGHNGQIYDEQTGKTLALIPYFDKENPEHLKNQKLFAAAPEMLNELKGIAERLQTVILDNPKRHENDPFIFGFCQALRDRCERITNEFNQEA